MEFIFVVVQLASVGEGLMVMKLGRMGEFCGSLTEVDSSAVLGRSSCQDRYLEKLCDLQQTPTITKRFHFSAASKAPNHLKLNFQANSTNLKIHPQHWPRQ
jgi:hypothetical protein